MRNSFGFHSGKSTVNAIFVLRQLQEKFRGKKKELFLVFVDLEKAFDPVWREAIPWALRYQKVPEHLIALVMAFVAMQGQGSGLWQVLQMSLG